MATTLAIPFSWEPASAAIESSSITVIDDGSGHGSEFQCQLEDPPGTLVDATDSDRVVCTNDTVTWGWGFNMNASGAQDATFTQTLPEGWTWDDLSIAACEGSGLEWTGVGTISADGRTLTCVINQPTGDIVQTLQIPVTANVGSVVPNGSTYAAELSLTEGGVVQTSAAEAVTVRSAPRYDLVKAILGGAIVEHDFGSGLVPAQETAWVASIVVPDADNTKGLEPLASPFTFVDNVSQISPNAVVVDVNSESSGTATFTQAGPGAPATITVTDADTAPAEGLNGSTNTVWSARVITRLPQSEIPPAPVGKDLINQFTDFLPTGINGTPNLGGTPEQGSEPGADCRNLTDSSAPPNNNCALAHVDGPGAAGVISGSKSLASGTNDDGTPCLPGATCPPLQGDTGGENGYAVPGTPVNAFMLLRVQGPATGVVLCDKWDPARQQFDPTRPIALSGSAGGAVAEADYRIEYTNQAYADDTARQAGGCGLPGDAATDGPWFTTVAAAGGPGAITGVRVTLLQTQPSGEIYWTVPMVAGTLGGPAPDFLSARADGMATSSPVSRNGYRITPQFLEVDKDTSPTNQINTSTGSTVTFTLDPSVTVPGNPAAPPVTGLRITDTLDPCQLGPALDASSTDWIMELTTPANNGPDGLPCTGDGESGAVLTFVHRAPFVTPNVPVQQIRYSVTVSPFVENNGSITNTAIISADGNTQDEESRTDAFTQRVAAPGAVRVSKTADFTPVEIEPDDISWTMSWSNTVLLPDTAGRTELIDVLPYNGDGRGTSFSGTFGLLGIDLLGSVADVSVVYTSQDPATIERDPATNTSTWCAEAQFGSPGCPTSMASVTAFKIINEDFRNGEFGGARIRVSPGGNVEEDIYVNNVAQGRTANLPEPIPATPNEPIWVVASSVGDTVWYDDDRDGVRDAGEAGIPDVTVRLYDAAGTQLRTAPTNADGQYTFGNLHSGTYRVDLDPATIPAGLTPTYDLDGGIVSPDRNSGVFTLEFDTDRIDVDFGEFRQPGVPELDIEKESAAGQDADTLETGVYVRPGTSVDVVIPVVNTGDKPLVDVVVSDETITGPDMTGFECTFPDGTTGSALPGESIRWEATFSAGGAPRAAEWAPGAQIDCTGTLTMARGDVNHLNTVTVEARDLDGTGVTDTDDFHSYTSSIDIVKFDGRQTAPANPVDGHDDLDGIFDGPTTGAWDVAVDADTTDDQVTYAAAGSYEVGFVVTNNGAIPVQGVSVTDANLSGPAVTGLSCDLTALGGPATGVEWEGPLDPGETFDCTGSLTLAPGETHQDSGSAEGTPVNPKTTVPEAPIDDEDRFTGTTPPKPTGGVDVEKFDEGFGTPDAYSADEVNAALALDADTPANAVAFTAGEARKVIIAISNDGDEDLIDLEVSDATTSGTGQIEGLSCDFSALGGPGTGASWEGPLSPGEHVYCSGTLTLGAAADHTDRATVTATGAESGDTYGDEDDFHGTTGEVTNERVTPPQPPAPGGTGSGSGAKGVLPRTGAGIASMTALGLGLVALGFVLSRRRRSTTAG
ncbi:MAG TPA: SdrD B-like domain-containing protein [Aquihabitans sp.]|jgi:LPXTG-motif cell wall-anchored protein|nr:SdrD B-like domain-containing protein [Aquihabitans sp.]